MFEDENGDWCEASWRRWLNSWSEGSHELASWRDRMCQMMAEAEYELERLDDHLPVLCCGAT